MKESLKKITAWIKAHPIPAAIIGLVVVVVGYLVVKSSGGNSSGESIDGGSLGAEESSPLVGLGGGDMSTGGTTSTGTTPESIPTSTGGVAAYNDISTPQAAESIGTFAAPSDYINESVIFSGPTSAAEVFNNIAKSTLADSGFTRSVAQAPTGNKNLGPALVSTNTGQPNKPVSGGGVAATLAKLTAPIKAPTLASIKPAPTKPTPYVAPKPSVNNIFSGALLGAGAKLKPAATPAFNIFKYIGTVSGYKWDAKLKKYVRTSTAQPLKAY